jgi:hypothetical protein
MPLESNAMLCYAFSNLRKTQSAHHEGKYLLSPPDPKSYTQNMPTDLKAMPKPTLTKTPKQTL